MTNERIICDGGSNRHSIRDVEAPINDDDRRDTPAAIAARGLFETMFQIAMSEQGPQPGDVEITASAES